MRLGDRFDTVDLAQPRHEGVRRQDILAFEILLFPLGAHSK